MVPIDSRQCSAIASLWFPIICNQSDTYNGCYWQSSVFSHSIPLISNNTSSGATNDKSYLCLIWMWQWTCMCCHPVLFWWTQCPAGRSPNWTPLWPDPSHSLPRSANLTSQNKFDFYQCYIVRSMFVIRDHLEGSSTQSSTNILVKTLSIAIPVA